MLSTIVRSDKEAAGGATRGAGVDRPRPGLVEDMGVAGARPGLVGGGQGARLDAACGQGARPESPCDGLANSDCVTADRASGQDCISSQSLKNETLRRTMRVFMQIKALMVSIIGQRSELYGWRQCPAASEISARIF
ncbi:hypothetical protein EJB05_14079, partial [Eragrostis curvula]